MLTKEELTWETLHGNAHTDRHDVQKTHAWAVLHQQL